MIVSDPLIRPDLWCPSYRGFLAKSSTVNPAKTKTTLIKPPSRPDLWWPPIERHSVPSRWWARPWSNRCLCFARIVRASVLDLDFSVDSVHCAKSLPRWCTQVAGLAVRLMCPRRQPARNKAAAGFQRLGASRKSHDLTSKRCTCLTA